MKESIKKTSTLKIVGNTYFDKVVSLLLQNDLENFIPVLDALADAPRKDAEKVAPLTELLLTFNPLTDLLRKKADSLRTLIEFIAINLKPEIYLRKTFLMHFGDKGEKFYILIKGKCAILIPIQITIMLTEEEYLLYLVKVYLLSEKKIFETAFYENKAIFAIKQQDIHRLIDILVNDSDNKSSPIKRLEKSLDEQLRQTYQLAKNFSDDNFFQTGDYCDFIYPKTFDPSKKRKEVKLLTYKHLTTLKEGDNFGEVALSDPLAERTATIITDSEPVILGTLSKKMYDECLREIREREKKNNINLLLSTIIFEGMSFTHFSKVVYSKLVHKKLHRGDFVIKQGESISNLQLLKKGEFELRLVSSVLEINKIIKDLGGSIPKEEEELGRMVGD